MIIVDVSSESRYPVDRARVLQVAQRVLKEYGVESAMVSVRIVGDRKMKWLNETYRKVKGTTDVLSFPTEPFDSPSLDQGKSFVYPKEEPFPLGDVVVSYPQARVQAMEREVLVDQEIEALIEHGVKSLLGYHPDND